ncbi:MAG TPA: NAD-dependent epimerase/dehydratase family protein [Solirubrobacterales bacterium]|nr:NAD-dependent epimerase/dehydratase family protein [Solirubrobacterales bacterium]
MARSLVTGGQGFIGGHLVKALLERGDEVAVLDLPEAPGLALKLHGLEGDVNLIEGDVADREIVDKATAGADSVFHLAAQTLVGPAAADPVGTFRSNVEGTWTVLEAAREAEVSAVVVASSDKAYGPSDALPYREGDELRPAAPYEGSKAAADVISRSYWKSWGLPVGVTRLANVYGGGDLNFSRLIPEVVAAYLAERQPQIRSDGSPQRDFLHVFDAVGAYLAIERAVKDGPARGEAMNAGTGEARSVRDVIERIKAATGSGQEPDYLLDRNPDGEIDTQYVDAARLAEIAGWKPEIAFEEGIAEAVEWYRARPAIIAGRAEWVRSGSGDA